MGEETCPKCGGDGEIEVKGEMVECPKCKGDGYVLVCDYCGKPATRETPVSGVYLCEDTDCWCQFVNDECEELEVIEEAFEKAVERAKKSRS